MVICRIVAVQVSTESKKTEEKEEEKPKSAEVPLVPGMVPGVGTGTINTPIAGAPPQPDVPVAPPVAAAGVLPVSHSVF
jgi:hypothetical protein